EDRDAAQPVWSGCPVSFSTTTPPTMDDPAFINVDGSTIRDERPPWGPADPPGRGTAVPTVPPSVASPPLVDGRGVQAARSTSARSKDRFTVLRRRSVYPRSRCARRGTTSQS